MCNETNETYTALTTAFDYFNEKLFDGRLPGVIITFQRKKGAAGYFHAEKWTKAGGNQLAAEIALHPDLLTGRSLTETLSTLVHEMCHLEQEAFGSPSRSGYHNKEWGSMMRAVGLIPSATGQEGGKETGQKMTHYIEEGGAFDLFCSDLLATGFVIPWGSSPDAPKAKKPPSKVKFSCPVCDQAAWGKPSLSIMCLDCDEQMEPQS